MVDTKAKVAVLPDCDFCIEQGVSCAAKYDGKTILGPWAYMCDAHFQRYGVGLGLGKGQELVLERE